MLETQPGQPGASPHQPQQMPPSAGGIQKASQGKFIQELASLHLFNIPPLPHPPPPWLLQGDNSDGQEWLGHPENRVMSPPARDEPHGTSHSMGKHRLRLRKLLSACPVMHGAESSLAVLIFHPIHSRATPGLFIP